MPEIFVINISNSGGHAPSPSSKQPYYYVTSMTHTGGFLNPLIALLATVHLQLQLRVPKPVH
jgi:hypothetical protein